jgi:hypothetical protein
MTPYAERLVAQADARKVRHWRHRLTGEEVRVVDRNLYGRVLIRYSDGQMREMTVKNFEGAFRGSTSA